MRTTVPSARWTTGATLVGVLAAGCSVTVNSPPADVLQVSSSSNVCSIENSTLSAGSITARVTNPGSVPSSFSITVEGESRPLVTIRDVAPGATKEAPLQLASGRYKGRCEPVGADAEFTVG